MSVCVCIYVWYTHTMCACASICCMHISCVRLHIYIYIYTCIYICIYMYVYMYVYPSVCSMYVYPMVDNIKMPFSVSAYYRKTSPWKSHPKDTKARKEKPFMVAWYYRTKWHNIRQLEQHNNTQFKQHNNTKLK